MPAIPTKLFDARNGNNAVDSDATLYPSATIIVFRDAAAKTVAIDAVCDLGNYASLDPATRPTKQVFYAREIQFWLRDKVRQSREKIEQAKVIVPDVSDLP